MLKSKLLHSDSIEELHNAQSMEDTTELMDTNDSNADIEEEHIPLLTVDENRDLESRNESNQQSTSYGATINEDKKND